jgi:hypothetical protein
LAARRASSAAAAFGTDPSDVEYPTVGDGTPEVIDTCSIPAVKRRLGTRLRTWRRRAAVRAWGEPVCEAVPVAVG